MTEYAMAIAGENGHWRLGSFTDIQDLHLSAPPAN
jgi:hypothetical protein